MKTITVTKADIKEGIRFSSQSCPVAKALNRACPSKRDYWSVGPVTMSFYPRKFKTPSDVQRFIKAFDAGKRVKPFSFTLPLQTKTKGTNDTTAKR